MRNWFHCWFVHRWPTEWETIDECALYVAQRKTCSICNSVKQRVLLARIKS